MRESKFLKLRIGTRLSGNMFVNKKPENKQSKNTENGKHNYHLSSSSYDKAIYTTTNMVNTIQKIIFSDIESLTKNAPAKKLARTIFAKSPTNFAINSFDLKLNCFIAIQNIASVQMSVNRRVI